MAALSTSTSTPPNAVSAASNSRGMAAGSLTSALTAIARPPSASIARTTSAASLSLRA